MTKKIPVTQFQTIREKLSRLSTTYFCDADSNIRVMNNRIKPINTKLKLIGQAFTVAAQNNVDAILKARVALL